MYFQWHVWINISVPTPPRNKKKKQKQKGAFYVLISEDLYYNMASQLEIKF